MKHINAEIISVGTELLLGQIANTNSQWISKKLADDGINVFYHSAVGDNMSRVKDLFEQAGNRSDIIVITGGLGPTEDDMTREAFQMLSEMEMVEHQPSMKKIVNYFKNRQTDMTANNRRQARVFKGAKVIDNKNGMAPGMIVDYANKLWFFLPGVPSEMKQMMSDVCLPYLRETFGDHGVIRSKVLRMIGIGEAKLEETLKELITNQTNPTIALLAQKDGIIIRLTAKAATEEKAHDLLSEAQSKIEERAGNYLYGTDYQTIEVTIASMLKERHLTISAAESLTGGMFTEKIISVPGASAICPGGVVSYDDKVKTDLLGVSSDIVNQKGTVSAECAEEMAQNVLQLLKTNIGISFTGVAGPDSNEGHLPGTVFIGISNEHGDEMVERFTFHGSREAVRRRSVMKGFELLYYFLKKHYT